MASHIFSSALALQIISLIVEEYFPPGGAWAWLLRRRSASCNLGGGHSQSSGSGEARQASLAGNNILNQTRAPRQSRRKGKVLFYASAKFFSKFLIHCYDATPMMPYFIYLISFVRTLQKMYDHWRFFAVCHFLQIGQLTDWQKVHSHWVIRHNWVVGEHWSDSWMSGLRWSESKLETWYK